MNNNRRNVPGIRHYAGPAGGWGALKATAIAVRTQMDALEAPATLLRTNQPDGFDCPGCAWPDKEHKSTFQFCENGAKAVTWEATTKRVTPDFFAAHTVSDLWAKSDFELEGYGRLTHPMKYDPQSDTFRPVEWDDAFARIGEVLRDLSPDQVEFYTSGRASNEAAFLYQLFARELGTNNFPDCSNMCHQATSVGLPRSIGIGKGTVSLEDFDHTELVISIGHNPGTNHPRMMGTLHELARRGVPIIVFNPLRETALERFADPQSVKEMATYSATDIASTYYQVKAGGDAAALKGIAKHLLVLDALDHDFIATQTEGFTTFAADIAATPWEAIERESGLSRADLENVAQIYAASSATIITYGMGITQHNKGTANVRLIADMLLLRGNIGKPGAGICPLRGHSNVQGNRTVGIDEKPPAVLLDSLARHFNFEPPRRPGHHTVDAINAMLRDEVKVLIALGGNLAAAAPDTPRTCDALRRCGLTVYISTKLNRSHLMPGKASLILPTLGRTEEDIQASGRQFITVEDSFSMVHASEGIGKPLATTQRSETAIIANIAHATLGDAAVNWLALADDYSLIRDHIAATLPGFADFNARCDLPGGFWLGNAAAGLTFNTPSGKAEFSAAPLPVSVREDAPFILQTLRSHDQYNTTIYGLDDRYRGVYGQREVLFMHADDIAALGLQDGDRVDITTEADDGIVRQVQDFKLVAYAIPRGNLAAYYPETNPLVPLSRTGDGTGTPTSKSIPVRVTKAQAQSTLRIA